MVAIVTGAILYHIIVALGTGLIDKMAEKWHEWMSR
jgi:hypothetical protein